MSIEQPQVPVDLQPIVQTLQQWNQLQGREAQGITFVNESARPRLIIRCLSAEFEQQLRNALQHPSWRRAIPYAITLKREYTVASPSTNQ